MKKYFKRKKSSSASQDGPIIADLMNKVQQQMSAVEKKLDILISQSSKRPFEKDYSQKPPRRFEHPNRHDRPRHGSGHREKTYTRVICADCSKECEVPFKPSAGRPVYCKECFSERKKGNLFNANQDNRPKERNFPQEPRSDKNKKRVEKKKKTAKKKKSFFARRKKRA